MFGGHIPELLLFLVVALVIFGPKRLPEVGGALGKGIRDFKKGLSDLEQPTSDQRLMPAESMDTTAGTSTERAVR